MCNLRYAWGQFVFAHNVTFSLISISLTRAVLFVASLHFRSVSLARLSSVHFSQKLARSALNPSTTHMRAVAPFGPRQPLTVDWTVLQETGLALRVRALAVPPVVLRDRVSARARPRLRSVVTCGAACVELCPFCPATINCTVELWNIIVWVKQPSQ